MRERERITQELAGGDTEFVPVFCLGKIINAENIPV